MSKGNYRGFVYCDDDILANLSIFFKYNDSIKICEIYSKLKIRTSKRLCRLTSLPFFNCYLVVTRPAGDTCREKSITNTILTTALYYLTQGFFYLDLLSRTFTIHRREGGGYFFKSPLPLPPASKTLTH